MSDIRDQNNIIWWGREELIAEVKRLRANLARVPYSGEHVMKLEAEIERLKAALHYARDCAKAHVDNKCFDCRALVAHIDAALEGKP